MVRSQDFHPFFSQWLMAWTRPFFGVDDASTTKMLMMMMATMMKMIE
jgi:hypothetical protein